MSLRWIFSLTCLMRRLSSAYRERGKCGSRSAPYGIWGRIKKTDFAEDIVNVAVVFCEPFGELVVLFREGPDINAAERVRLRERQREREAGAPADCELNSRQLSSVLYRRVPVGPGVKGRQRERGTRALSWSMDHSPLGGSQVTLTTLSNSSSSLTTIGW